jgi:glycosyltransferase involved in cell wall biosynthesis
MQAVGGGAEKQSILVAEALKKAFDITLVVLKPVGDYWRTAMERKGFRVVALQKEDTFLERRLRDHRFLKVCISLKPDLVYSRWIKLNIAMAKGRDHGVLRCGLIIQVASTLTRMRATKGINGLLLRRSTRRYYSKADLIVCNGSMARKDLIDSFGLPSEKCVYLPNLLRTEDLEIASKEKVWSKQDEPLRIVSVGRLIPQKDYSTLIRAVAKISGEVPFRVEIFGDGSYKRKLEKDIVKSGLGEVVTLRGPVSNPQIYFPNFDLLVSCSLHEGMSNVMLEAMAAGLPVVVTEVSGSRDVLTNPSQGVIFPPGDADKLASILKSLALNRERLIVLSRGGRRRAADFSLPKLGEEYQRLFRGVVAVRHSKVG